METRLEQSLRTCSNVKNRQTKEQTKAVAQIEEIIEKENLLDHKVLIVKLDSLSFDRNLIGLVANGLMAKYQRPTCVLHKIEKDGKILWSGSARACGVDDFRAFCEDSGLSELAQGHPSAHGIMFSEDKIDAFIDLCDKEFADKDFSTKYKVDFIESVSSFKPKDVLEIADYKTLWGQEVSEPLIAIENISITKDMLQLMSRDKNPTLKIMLPNGINMIKFKSSEDEFNSLYSENGCITINVVGKCEKNVYMGNVSPQLIIKEYEIISKQDYYF